MPSHQQDIWEEGEWDTDLEKNTIINNKLKIVSSLEGGQK